MARQKMPDRRANETLTFEVGAVTYHGSIGRAFDEVTASFGPAREVFLTAGKPGSAVDISARDAALCASIALQSGASLDDLRGTVSRHSYGRPEGPLGIIFDEIAAEDARLAEEATRNGGA
tara:strand:- start:1543 stop:1905 length:363 start_codon:yes stop_codon:yes gene_type:complete